MTVSTAALLLACVDTVMGAAALWLILRLYNQRKEPDMKHIRDVMREREWRERRGRFADCDPDEPGRVQIMPGEPPEPELQTHNIGPDGIREAEGLGDGA